MTLNKTFTAKNIVLLKNSKYTFRKMSQYTIDRNKISF